MKRFFIVCFLLAFTISPVLGLAADPSPKARAHKDAGNKYLRKRDYAQAEAHYLAAIGESKGFTDAHYNLGMLYFYHLKDFSRAVYHLNEYANLDPFAQDIPQVRDHVAQAIKELENVEFKAYSKAVDIGTEEALDGFIEKYPASSYVDDAKENKQILKAFRETEGYKQAKQAKAYRAALDAGTVQAMEKFISDYPSAPQAASGHKKLAELKAKHAKVKNAYLMAKQIGTEKAYLEFIDEYTDTKLAADAKKELALIKTAEKALSGAVKAGTITALEGVIKKFPSTVQAASAQREIDRIRAEEREREAKLQEAKRQLDTDWAQAKKKDTAKGYKEFLTKHPLGPDASMARKRITVLELEAQKKAPTRKPAAAEEDLGREKLETLEEYRKEIKSGE